METLNVEEVDHKQILNTGVRHPDNDPGRAVFIGPPQALQILTPMPKRPQVRRHNAVNNGQYLTHHLRMISQHKTQRIRETK